MNYETIYGKVQQDEQGNYKEVRCFACYTLLGRQWQNGRHQGVKHGNGRYVQAREVFALREVSKLKTPPLTAGDVIFLCDTCETLAAMEGRHDEREL